MVHRFLFKLSLALLAVGGIITLVAYFLGAQMGDFIWNGKTLIYQVGYGMVDLLRLFGNVI